MGVTVTQEQAPIVPAPINPPALRLAANAQIPYPVCYRIEKPRGDHAPDEIWMMSFGSMDKAVAPVNTVGALATYVAADTRIGHVYYGPMTVYVWPRRDDEHYRTPPPATAYRLDIGDQTDTINPNTKAAVEQLAAERENREH
jgi:hypothetical protein